MEAQRQGLQASRRQASVWQEAAGQRRRRGKEASQAAQRNSRKRKCFQKALRERMSWPAHNSLKWKEHYTLIASNSKQ